MRRAYAYFRLSSAANLEGDGFPRQRAAVQQYAASHDIEIVDEYLESAVSGTRDCDARPAFAAMRQDMLASGIKTVVIEKLDRLARDLMVQETIIADFARCGLGIVSDCEDDVMTPSPTRILVRQVMGAISQYEKSMIVGKLRAARDRQRASTGRCEGRKPYGHAGDEADVVRRIRALCGTGMSYPDVAEQLRRENLRTRYGRPFTAQRVYRIAKGNA